MNNIAIITARGGSKRIFRKNIKLFMGKPMIAYAIESALQSDIFDDVMVSTDDMEIADIAKQYGANIPFMRSEKTSGDFATTFDVIDEVINEYQKRDISFTNFCCIYPCVPFLSAQTLQNAYQQFQGFNALIPVCKFSTPIEWAVRIENNVLLPYNRDAQNMRSQDLIPKYFDVGMFYFCKTKAMYQYNSLTPDNTTAFIMDEKECHDIDTLDDWIIAEIKYKIIQGVQ